MGIILREFVQSDLAQVACAIRDSHNTLRKSRGGTHPDGALDRFLSVSDAKLAGYVLRDAKVIVAFDEGSGKVAGVCAFTSRISDRLLGSTYLKGLYVREGYQRGKSGAKVGSMLRDERLRLVGRQGFRKVYAFAVPESIGFHKKSGAVFYPQHDIYYLENAVCLAYYEIILKKSVLNGIRIEPYLHRAGNRIFYLYELLRGLLRLP